LNKINQKSGYKELPHTADVYYEAYGPDLNSVFERIGEALFNTMTDIKKIEPKKTREIKVEAEDLESLVFEFIRELLYILDVEEELFSQFKIKITEFKDKFLLMGTIKGEKLDRVKHISKTEVKAPTYAQMEIIRIKEKIIIRFVLDI
jgi:SHS2 domain-containing protein